MYLIHRDNELKHIESRVLHYANKFNRTLPEIKFIVVDGNEFISLISKNVYPTSPVNIWEGKEVVMKKSKVESGQESSIYYEVVQTGRPSYAYLNNTNSLTTQASVMAHVIGHCEFSELNVMRDSNDDRTEYIIYLTNQIKQSIPLMGFNYYNIIRNACESLVNLIHPNSRFNLSNSILSDETQQEKAAESSKEEEKKVKLFSPISTTLDHFISPVDENKIIEEDEVRKITKETIDRRGYKLIAPCQDVVGFLKKYAPLSSNERYIVEYIYQINRTHDFVARTQIMNEGWAMYWEKKIMCELFSEKTVKDIVDYSVKFSGVCFPRPWFARNPYHLGYNMWQHIERLYKEGKVSIDYMEEIDREKKDKWNKETNINPMDKMEHLVSTITDYEFLRRYLTPDLIEEFHLNKIPAYMKGYINMLSLDEIKKEDNTGVWVYPELIKDKMLNFFVDLGRPLIYIIDSDFNDGGLLLYHKHDGRALKEAWIKPTLKKIKYLWKAPVSLLSSSSLYTMSGDKLEKIAVSSILFEEVCEAMSENKKPFRG